MADGVSVAVSAIRCEVTRGNRSSKMAREDEETQDAVEPSRRAAAGEAVVRELMHRDELAIHAGTRGCSELVRFASRAIVARSDEQRAVDRDRYMMGSAKPGEALKAICDTEALEASSKILPRDRVANETADQLRERLFVAEEMVRMIRVYVEELKVFEIPTKNADVLSRDLRNVIEVLVGRELVGHEW